MSRTMRPDNYDLFYMEIPRADIDPLNELTSEFEDESIIPDYSRMRGLSDEQVSELARDSLQEARRQPNDRPPDEHDTFGEQTNRQSN